jgi:itaconyl-CoA hydratase
VSTQPGRFLEDFAPGQVLDHPFGRTVLEADCIWFSLLTCNPHQLHTNADFVAKQGLERMPVANAFTLSVALGLAVVDVSLNAVANVEWNDITFPLPVFAGDTIYARTEVLAVDVDAGVDGDRGALTVRTTARNQRDDVVAVFTRTMVIRRRETAQ